MVSLERQSSITERVRGMVVCSWRRSATSTAPAELAQLNLLPLRCSHMPRMLIFNPGRVVPISSLAPHQQSGTKGSDRYESSSPRSGRIGYRRTSERG